jgi:hypothetical protein
LGAGDIVAIQSEPQIWGLKMFLFLQGSCEPWTTLLSIFRILNRIFMVLPSG